MHTECPGRTRFQMDLKRVAYADYDFELLRNSTVLITGATGLVGGALTRAILCANRLRGLNMRVLAPVRSMEKAKKALDGVWGRPDLCAFEADITDSLSISEPVDYIVHAASATSSGYFMTNPVETIHVSFMGTENALNLAREKKIRGMVYLSSMEAFGITDSSLERVTEKQLGYIDPQAIRSCYSESKRMAECLASAYAAEYGVPVRSARLAQTFGAGVQAGESRAFMQFALSALKGQPIVLHTTGESYGNYVYLADCIHALLLLLTRGENGDVYTVSNESACVKIKELARITAQNLSNPEVNVVFDIPKDRNKFGYAPDTKLRLSSGKLQALGWQPQVELRDMLKYMAQDIKEQNLLF